MSSVGREHLRFSGIDTICMYMLLYYDGCFDYLVSFEVRILICDRGVFVYDPVKRTRRGGGGATGWEYGGTTFAAELPREQGLERGFRGGRNHVHSPHLRRLTGTYTDIRTPYVPSSSLPVILNLKYPICIYIACISLFLQITRKEKLH